MEGLSVHHLIVHPICPFAQRALMVWSFKGVQGQVTEVDLFEKPAWFLALNPEGKVPTLKVTRDGHDYILIESTNVAEYLDTLPGQSLYPRYEGHRDPIAKNLIDVFIKTKVDPLFSAFLPFFYGYNTDNREKAINLFRDLNSRLNDASFVMSKELNTDHVTLADVVLFPLVHTIAALNFLWGIEEVKAFSNIWDWHTRMTGFEWVSKNAVAESRLINLQKRYRTGERGLRLPLTRYDEELPSS